MNQTDQNTLGNIFLSHRAICTIVSRAAQMSVTRVTSAASVQVR